MSKRIIPDLDGTAQMDRRGFMGGAAAAGLALMLPVSAIAQSRAIAPSIASGRWVVTTQKSAWQAGVAPEVITTGPGTSYDLELAPDTIFQMIEGFGACFNEMGWDALSLLPPLEREAVFQELFGNGGAGFNICRMPLGANDFSREWYSYDETPGDFALRDFSIAHDETALIPFISAARRIRPDLRLWASPWSPPAWMKTNGHYASVPNRPNWPDNGLRDGQQGREGTDMFIQDNRYFDAYARYFGRFVDAYAKRGIPIGMVMPQNEFNSPQPFPSCCWTPEGLARFLPYLGREMDRRGVDIFLGTLERANDGLLEQIYADSAAASVIRGIGVQWAGRGAMPWLRRAHPTLRFYQTEQECGDGQNDWRYARYCWSMMKTYLQNGANAYQYWNIALVEGGISRWGWAQNSLITVDAKTRGYRWNHEYWLMKHFAAVVKQGARRIGVTGWRGYEDVLAFRNVDGSIVAVAHNPLADPMPLRLKLRDQIYSATLPADSFASIVLT